VVQSDNATEPQVATFKTAGGRWLLKGVERLEHAFRSAVEEALYELFTQSVRADSLPMQFIHAVYTWQFTLTCFLALRSPAPCLPRLPRPETRACSSIWPSWASACSSLPGL
jgi:hypothetical protein